VLVKDELFPNSNNVILTTVKTTDKPSKGAINSRTSSFLRWQQSHQSVFFPEQIDWRIFIAHKNNNFSLAKQTLRNSNCCKSKRKIVMSSKKWINLTLEGSEKNNGTKMLRASDLLIFLKFSKIEGQNRFWARKELIGFSNQARVKKWSQKGDLSVIRGSGSLNIKNNY